ncbi:unnamed protein product [Cladocopium goreaui]|uniref:Anthranilate phosphoribosyltransferase n=1 Tax=Cladocopium goreaui TaxID=2562237 RepID=A0A9P1FJZ3_9DINO|nr:unnamed protein product [Cladocopium goreaui]
MGSKEARSEKPGLLRLRGVAPGRFSSGARGIRSPRRGRLWGFDVGKYGLNMKGACFILNLAILHGGTYETLKDVDGNFQSTLRLTDRAREAARLRNGEYKGEVCPTKPEAEHSAARGFWDDPLVKEIAAKLEPSKKARKNRKMCAEANAKRKALYGYGPGGKRITREDRKGVEKALSGHHVPCVAGAGSGFARRFSFDDGDHGTATAMFEFDFEQLEEEESPREKFQPGEVLRSRSAAVMREEASLQSQVLATLPTGARAQVLLCCGRRLLVALDSPSTTASHMEGWVSSEALDGTVLWERLGKVDQMDARPADVEIRPFREADRPWLRIIEAHAFSSGEQCLDA